MGVIKFILKANKKIIRLGVYRAVFIMQYFTILGGPSFLPFC